MLFDSPAGLSVEASFPNLNPVEEDEDDELVEVAGIPPNLKLGMADAGVAPEGLAPGLGSSHDLHRKSLSAFLTMHTEHSH